MKPIIKLRSVTYTYEDEEKPILKDLSLEVYEGEFVLIVGPSGSGKSTVCQTFNGIIPNLLDGEISGEIFVDDKDVLALEPKDLSNSIGLVFQDPDAQLCNIYVEDEVAFAPENQKIDPSEIRIRIKKLLEKVGLQGYENRKVFELSGGQKQKVGIASVLAMEPKILVLDNATANLDPQATRDVFDLLEVLNKEHGHTVVVVESKIDDIMHLADRVLVMDDGRIVKSGTPREVLEHSINMLINMGLWVPEISELAVKLRDDGYHFKQFPITVEEAESELKQNWSREFAASSVNVESRKIAQNNPILTVNDLSYQYPNGTKALSNVSFSIEKGDFIAILGTNGSGKTTLVKHLMGIIKSPKNTVLLNGDDIHKKELVDMTESIGYVFQNPEHQFVADNVLEEAIYSLLVKQGRNENGDIPEEIIKKGEEVLRSIDLLEIQDKHPFMLSGGEKRRLSVISSLIFGQEVVILDEPTTGQDYASATKLLQLCKELQNQGKTIIMITHDIRLVCKWANSALVMSEGNLIYDGTVNHLFLREDVMREASLLEPPISKLAKKLSPYQLEEGVITIEQFFSTTEGRLEGNEYGISIS